ncbi:MAG: molybdopterin molybdotransferase MoeA [Pseudomonadota bacterium]
MISVRQASEIIAEHIEPAAAERIAIADAAGRILAQPVRAERAHPPFDRVTMDGVAIRWSETLPTTLRIAGRQLAGEPARTLPADDCAMEIMTGAVLCAGADTVVPVERYTTRSSDDDMLLDLEAGYAPERGQFIHRAGSDHAAGTTLLPAGVRIGGTEMAILHSAGETQTDVRRMPRVAIVATGDELVAAGEPIAAHQIRLSNGPGIAAALHQRGFTQCTTHHLKDSREQLMHGLADLLHQHDVLVLSGGVSKGKADFIPEVLEALGVTRLFHFVAQRPGKPMWFGQGPQGQLVFGLPGNPVSTLSCCRRYVVPALEQMTGLDKHGPATAKLATDWHFKPELTAFVPVVIQPDNAGQLWAAPLTTNTSGDFAALAGSHGFVELPAKRKSFAAGEAFSYYPW